MSFFQLLLHLCGLVAPAVAVGGLVALVGPWVLRQAQPVRPWWWQSVLNSLAGAAALAMSLAVLERDGKMLGYGALVLAVALTQALGQRAWR